jgi:hypothetical protein
MRRKTQDVYPRLRQSAEKRNPERLNPSHGQKSVDI